MGYNYFFQFGFHLYVLSNSPFNIYINMKYLKSWKIFEKKSISDMDDYKKGDYHQVVMNIGYYKWQSGDDVRSDAHGWSDQDMLNWLGSIDGRFKLLVQLGNYNYQVGNGGHRQYFDNGYASVGSSGFSGNHQDIENHDNMMESIVEYGLMEKYPIFKKAYSVMKQFEEDMRGFDERCDECDGSGYVEETCYDCNGEGSTMVDCDECYGSEDECDSCGGSGEVEEECEYCSDGTTEGECEYCTNGELEIPDMGGIDSQWYEISDEVLEVCNQIAKEALDEVYGG